MFIKNRPEVWKLEIHPFKFCPKLGDPGKLGIQHLAHMSLRKRYYMLQNATVTAFTVINGKLIGGGELKLGLKSIQYLN